MGSIMSAISDDIDTYEGLCQQYGEKVQYTHGGPDCYGSHAADLKKRQAGESVGGPTTRFDRPDPI